MSKEVLVLNASYEPLSLVSIRRAVVLLLREKAELIEATSSLLRSASRIMAVPLVIRLVQYVRLPHRKVPPTRASILLRDANTCQYCGEAPGRRNLTIDHVLPRSKGGQHIWGNLVTACKRCNQKKGASTPSEAMMKLLRKPIEPSYVTLVLLGNPVAAARLEQMTGAVA